MTNKSIKVSKVLFYSALILAEIGWMFVKVKVISDYCGLLIDLAICALVACCILQSRTYSIKTILAVIAMVAVFAISAVICENSTLLLLLLFCLAGKNLNFDEIIRKNWKIMAILITIVLACYYLGVTDIYYMYRDDGAIRSSMGFSHPNAFGAYLFSTFCQCVYSNRDNVKKKWLFVIVGVILAAITAVCSDSRGSSLSYIILLAIVVFSGKIKALVNRAKLARILVIIFPILLLVGSLIIASCYDSSNKMMNKANTFLTYRISSASYVVKQYDMKAFGQKIDLISTEVAKKTGKNAFVLDNAYVKLLYQYGVLPTVLFVALYCIAIGLSLKEGKWLLTAMLIVFAIRGLTGNIMFNVYGNVFLLYFSTIIYRKVKNAR